MKIGYCRVSTTNQDLQLQIDELKKAGCEKIYEDKISGAKWDRQGLDKMMNELKAGDTVIVWKLDRLGRSLKQLIDAVNHFKEMNISFISLTENFDTTSAGGELIFNIFGAMAQFERSLIKERVNAGLKVSRAKGVIGGRPNSLNETKRKVLFKMYESREHTAKELCEIFGISRSTFFRELKLLDR